MKKCFSILCLTLWAMQAVAHPHAFIDLKTKLLVENNQLVGFSTQWTLDAPSSSELLYELKRSDEQGKQNLTEELFKNIVYEHYFSYLYDRQNNKIKFKKQPINYGLKAVDARLQYYFDVQLAKPVDLSNNEFTLMIYDKTYYVAMFYPATDKSILDFSQLPSQCHGKLLEPQVNAKIQQYASSLDQTQRDEDDTLGQMFAQRIQIICQ
ncbi:MAG: zinc transporter binding subunit ZevA [[Actinobacillus] rossii]|nr:zinc transporter binding subunit ZevA [[Actinobacillus] rossii]MDD7426071.1 zinc transporter binding subunit ZevA [[Actinobacillus] rossii]MDY3123925.1 zinc transporter binding subunit ZevA [[Actinobacillus] rossii]MDY4506909.1 zinc transporter binding subunit ZevA [[Actinobacillus] rossii]